MRAIWVIAKNTYVEIIRDRILYGLLVFTLLLIGLSLLLGQLSFAEQARIAANFGFASIHLSAVIISIFVGSSLVNKEIEKKTVMTLLSRPISRPEFLVGKIFGLLLINATVITCLAVVLFITFQWLHMSVDSTFILALHGIFLESSVLLGLAIFFGTFATAAMVVPFTLGLFFIGHWLDSLRFFAEKSQTPTLVILSQAAAWLLPNLETFNWRSEVVFAQEIPWPQFWQANAYAFAWLILLITLSSFIFRRRDFG